MILLVYASHKLRDSQIVRLAGHNISHFSLLARLVRLARFALIFSQESLIFHKIIARKIVKRDSLSTLSGGLEAANRLTLSDCRTQA
jgi:hypothetical protein